MARSSIRWNTTDLQVGLETFDRKFHTAIEQVVDYQARQSETYMRTNARWTDRTTNARNGLHARTSRDRNTYTIVLAHSVPYGIWLEVRWSGKYGIIPEAVRQGGHELMRLISRLFNMI
jgi:hypothetical protein